MKLNKKQQAELDDFNKKQEKVIEENKSEDTASDKRIEAQLKQSKKSAETKKESKIKSEKRIASLEKSIEDLTKKIDKLSKDK